MKSEPTPILTGGMRLFMIFSFYVMELSVSCHSGSVGMLVYHGTPI